MKIKRRVHSSYISQEAHAAIEREAMRQDKRPTEYSSEILEKEAERILRWEKKHLAGSKFEMGDRVIVVKDEDEYAGEIGTVKGMNTEWVLVVFEDGSRHFYMPEDIRGREDDE